MNISKYLMALILIFSCQALSAGNETEKRWGFAPIAAPYYTPDTGLAVGAYLVTYISPESGGEFSRPDEISCFIAYTEKKQVTFGLAPNIFFGNGAFKLSGDGEINKYPSLFWGTGPDTDDDAEESYTPVETWWDLAFMMRTGRAFYIGPAVHVRFSRISETESGGIIEEGNIPGSDGTRETGAGLSFQFDTRNSIFYPTRGFFVKGKGMLNRSEFSGEYNFSRFEFDARWFAGITGDHVIAFQLKSEAAFGDVPLQSLCGIGGNEIMRGYLNDRYLDKSSIAAQAEYRFPLVWRLAGVIFAAAGEVQESLSEYNPGDIHYSAGGGLRLIIDRSQHIAARIDCGVDGDGDPNIYFLVKEAF